ncbi:MAG: hypothetical protein KGI38_09090 [Thaumarchaeota archaeon]|nr:hypothetical protein [Nitrososphaerota archaeon]
MDKKGIALVSAIMLLLITFPPVHIANGRSPSNIEQTTWEPFGHPNLHSSTYGSYSNSSGLSRRGDPDWAIGAYSTTLGLASYSGVWTHLASSYGLADVTFAAALLNVGYNVTQTAGTCTVNGQNVNVDFYGELFQAAIVFRPTNTYSIPSLEILYMAKPTGGGADIICAGTVYDSTLHWGSSLASTVTQTLVYTTQNGFQGWWYRVTLSNGSSYYISSDPNRLVASGTASKQTGGGDSFDPSLAFEVNEATSGNFFTDNPNFNAEANVGGQSYYSYGAGATPGFDIGASAPPGTAYGSGLTDTVSGITNYYDELGTSNGVSGWFSSHWSLWTPRTTQSGGSNLPNENYICSGSTCSGSYHFTTSISGCPSGSSCSVSPSSGYYTDGAQIQVQASISGGCGSFKNWSGSGSGSYSGSNNPVTVTMDNNNVAETANFLNVCTPQG